MCCFVRWMLFTVRFAVDERVDDIGIWMSRFVLAFDMLKAGKVMTERQFGTKLSSPFWLTAARCAEKITPPTPDKTTTLRLFKD